MVKKKTFSFVEENSGVKSLVFYCYAQKHSFSRPAYEVGDDGKFVMQNGMRVPYFDINNETGAKRRKRVTFEFTQLPDIIERTEAGKMIKYKSRFILRDTDLYYEDLYKKLTEDAEKGESPVLSEEAFKKRESPKTYAIEKEMNNMKQSYEEQIAALKAENEKLKGGK